MLIIVRFLNFFVFSVIAASAITIYLYVSSYINSERSFQRSLHYADYSIQGKEYNPLKNILLKANYVEYIGNEKIKILGINANFSNFRVIAPIKVQTSPIIEQSPVFEAATGSYLVSIAYDSNDRARKEFLNQVRTYWSKKSLDDFKYYEYLPRDEFLWSKSNCYVIYSQPYTPLSGEGHLFYSHGKIIRVYFEKLLSGKGIGGLQSFLDSDLAFKFSDTQISTADEFNMTPRKFLKLYKSGYFENPPKL